MLNIELRNQIKEYALQNPKVELCGLILNSGDSTFIYKCKNISSNPSKHFEISSLDYLRAWQEGKNKIIGFFHTQESSKPSYLDIINYRNHKLPSYIYSHESGEIFEVTDKHLNYNKYLGRAFEIGVNDCFSLVRDFYKQEYNIEIFNYPRTDGWFEQNSNIIKDNYSKENFRILNDNEVLQEGDVLEFFNFHFSIYLDGDLMLTHERNKYSTIEKFDMPWKNRVTNIYRFEKV